MLSNLLGKEKLEYIISDFFKKNDEKSEEFSREKAWNMDEYLHKYYVRNDVEYLEFTLNFLDYSYEYRLTCRLNTRTNRHVCKLRERKITVGPINCEVKFDVTFDENIGKFSEDYWKDFKETIAE